MRGARGRAPDEPAQTTAERACIVSARESCSSDVAGAGAGGPTFGVRQTWRDRAGELGMSSTHLVASSVEKDRSIIELHTVGLAFAALPVGGACRSSSGRFPIAPTLTEPLGWLTRKVPCQHGRSAQHRSAEHNLWLCAARVPRCK